MEISLRLFFRMWGHTGNSTLVKPTNTNNSVEVPSTPTDTISAIAWSPTANVVACASWDKQVRVWEVTSSLGSSISVVPRCAYSHDAPVLCVAFTKDGTSVVSGSCDGKVKMFNLLQQKETLLGTHDGPVKDVFWVAEMNMAISTSWDKTVRFWNGVQQTPVAVLPLPERAYSADVKFPVLTVALADRKVAVYNLQTIQQNPNPTKVTESKLKLQSRVVSIFPDKTGYALASVEGRCSICSIDDQNKDKNFEFKCHRTTDEIFAVNAIDFHPNGVFLTGGADGQIVIWDKDSRSRVKQFNSCNYPITAAKFSSQGDYIAFAVGYDWSKGHEHYQPSIPVKLYVNKLQEVDVKPQKQAAQGNSNFRRR